MSRTSSAAKVQEQVGRLERFQSSCLTAAKFCQTEGDSCRLQIDATQLSMLLSGVSLVEADKRRKRYVAPTKAAG